ncbi:MULTISPECIES: hypothetical protein [unclassified Tolypothrix]|uniref:hypothetical protein n=1 Tax=unclassified Tolypothrix TaxID=2649714 RepID=UPI0005EAAB35|nr:MULTISPECIES: hypothetical protein [unclassified Tolypothrix]BAY88574.1 hypothetical protein NIES3275_05520 [Microchaete diplosiphon NIES-3275]EKE97141.1 hypothetical protein FDUTEX481_05351 [Tolypothrix sp. PCC 7601]MBE9082670.1 hypothetical protein [Tolypothrix sp. LEGE 11397]UYD29247.1 hypothetical protein HGR01_15120 [Tolypothrix sp. PCC 7712]UYD34841.1 hypothetical protein HG267_03210 [Tolypothrix sp. PCC 7601]
MNNKKILLVSPFPNDDDLYPHIRHLINELSVDYDIDYFYGHERGIWTEQFNKKLKEGNYKPVINILKDLMDLYTKKNQNYKFVLAIDNFLYIISDLIFKNKTILWSQDFVGYDEKKNQQLVQKNIALITRKTLHKNQKIIIQDSERLEALLKSISYDGMPNSVFFLPVSLPPIQLQNKYSCKSQLPIIMQSGTIANWRFSNELIICHQQNLEKFNLFLQGFLTPEIEILLKSLEVSPHINSSRVPPDKLSEIIQLCDIGFIGYAIGDVNHYYISKASGQLVEFIRCGKPVIVKTKTNLQQYVEENKIGVAIKDIDELVPAIQKIQNSYQEYSGNCIQLFEHSFNIKKYTEKLLLFLE